VRKRVLVVHHLLHPVGGGNSVAAWILEALKDAYDVSLLTRGPVDYEGVNRTFGTSIQPGDFSVIQSSPLAHAIAERTPMRGYLLQTALLERSCKRLAARLPFDAIVAVDMEMDFGRRGIQYVSFPWQYHPDAVETPRWYRPRSTIAFYRAFCANLSSRSIERLRKNITLGNSRYIAEVIRKVHGIESTVVHPPVPGGFPEIPWDQRQDAVVGIGRLAPEKRWDAAVEIVRRVREGGRELTFTLIATPQSEEAARPIRELAVRYRDWFTLRTNVPRHEMVGLVARHRYGIHAMEGEHFGIAVAELQRAGCLPFVHRSGGPMEIVGDEEDLMFRTTEEATAKILRVMGNPALQVQLQARARERAVLFSTEVFAANMCRVVEEFRS
jgi:glycosyltransferase involved in cell wall biosynthesis